MVFMGNKIWEKQARQKRKKFLKDYLRTHPCVDCGNADIRVLEFDHVRGQKKFNIGQFKYAIPTLIKEIEKCEVRCSNCHKKRHDVLANAAWETITED